MTIYEANNINPNINEINRLKKELSEYDYIGIKIATGVATREQYASEIARAEALRQRIRELGG